MVQPRARARTEHAGGGDAAAGSAGAHRLALDAAPSHGQAPLRVAEVLEQIPNGTNMLVERNCVRVRVR